jgi:hypothetical protein
MTDLQILLIMAAVVAVMWVYLLLCERVRR